LNDDLQTSHGQYYSRMSSEKPLFLCLDCGGSKTAAVLVDNSGNVVGRGTGGPSNFMDVGMNAFLRSVKTAVQAALEEAVGSKVCIHSDG
jgi:N-acetylglucosamine kinase-like BadF-type ATPase